MVPIRQMSDSRLLNNITELDIKNIAFVPDSQIAEYERQQDQIQRDNKLKLSDIPTEYRAGFDKYITKTEAEKKLLSQVLKSFESWKTGNYQTVCLLGNNGIGKTKLANAFLFESLNHTFEKYGLKNHYSIKYRLLDEIKNEYANARSYTEKRNPDDVIKGYSEIDLLVIDEVGFGEHLDEQKTVFYKLINARDLKKKTTLICSNMAFNEFATFSGRAVMDRLKNSGVFPTTSGIQSHRGEK